jgi:Mor family transcriptional regulator
VSRGADFVAELLDAMPGVEARRAAQSVLSRWGGVSVYLPRSEGRERARVASLLLSALSHADAVRCLAARASVSESQARRILRKMRESGATVGGIEQEIRR